MIFDSIDWATTWRDLQHVGISYLLTAVIGWDREQEQHATGLRTFPIVGMASCGYILILARIAIRPPNRASFKALLGSVSIGGGAIVKEGASVKGTATAASVWNAGVIGASVAMDHYGIALVLTLLNLFTLRTLLPLKKRLDKD